MCQELRGRIELGRIDCPFAFLGANADNFLSLTPECLVAMGTYHPTEPNELLARAAFASYSRSDGALVGPIVAAMRTMGSYVFLDTDSILPGKRWQEELEAALDKADIVIVFWCRHSRASVMVAKEYKLALEKGKDILPVLFDDTQLDSRLAEFQTLDFRLHGAAAHNVHKDDLVLMTQSRRISAPAPDFEDESDSTESPHSHSYLAPNSRYGWPRVLALISLMAIGVILAAIVLVLKFDEVMLYAKLLNPTVIAALLAVLILVLPLYLQKSRKRGESSHSAEYEFAPGPASERRFPREAAAPEMDISTAEMARSILKELYRRTGGDPHR